MRCAVGAHRPVLVVVGQPAVGGVGLAVGHGPDHRASAALFSTTAATLVSDQAVGMRMSGRLSHCSELQRPTAHRCLRASMASCGRVLIRTWRGFRTAAVSGDRDDEPWRVERLTQRPAARNVVIVGMQQSGRVVTPNWRPIGNVGALVRPNTGAVDSRRIDATRLSPTRAGRRRPTRAAKVVVSDLGTAMSPGINWRRDRMRQTAACGAAPSVSLLSPL
jgi:hypothetical protein